jgi:hypothetical protein
MDKAIVKSSPFAFCSVAVPAVPMIDIINEHGVPYYLKVDIEGSDHLCLRDGEERDGSWQTLEEVAYAWLHDRFAHGRTKPIWVDIHARRD